MYATSAKINIIEVENTHAKIATLNGKTYIVPLGCISDGCRTNIIAPDKQIRNACTKNAQNKIENNGAKKVVADCGNDPIF